MSVAKQQGLQIPSSGSNSGNTNIINSARGVGVQQNNCDGAAVRRHIVNNGTSAARYSGGRPVTIILGGGAQRRQQTDNNIYYGGAAQDGGGRPLAIDKLAARHKRRRQTVQENARRRGTRAPADRLEYRRLRRGTQAAAGPFLLPRLCGRASPEQNKRQQAPMPLARSPERVPLQHHEDRDDRQGCWG